MIKFCDVSFCYGEAESAENRQEACVEGMSFDIRDGECVVLCGRSGAGKSTVLRLINGLAPVFYEGTLHGSVLVAGKEPSSMPPKSAIKPIHSLRGKPVICNSAYFFCKSSFVRF